MQRQAIVIKKVIGNVLEVTILNRKFQGEDRLTHSTQTPAIFNFLSIRNDY
jgi:hypothetical protein